MIFQVYRNNLQGSSSKSGSRISSAVLHQHAMGRHGIHSISSSGRGAQSPSTTGSPSTMSPSSSMTMPADTTDPMSSEFSRGTGEAGSSNNSRRGSMFGGGGSILSKEEQEYELFLMLQRQTTSALRGGKIPHSIISEDNVGAKGKQVEATGSVGLPTSYDVATLQFN